MPAQGTKGAEKHIRIKCYRNFLPILLFMIAGIIACSLLPVMKTVWIVFALFCLGFSLVSFIRKRPVLFKILPFFFCIGYIGMFPYMAPEYPAHHVAAYLDQEKIKITGIIDSRLKTTIGRDQFYLQVLSIGEDKVEGRIRVTVRWKDRETSPGLSEGDHISFISRIKSVKNFKNPKGFNYKRYMMFKGVCGTAYTNGVGIEIERPADSRTLAGIIGTARSAVTALIDKTCEGDHNNVMKALIIGDRSGITPSMRNDFNRAGTGHLLAISGLHIGIVAAVSFFLFSWILSHVRLFLWNAWTKKGAAVFSLVPVVLYGLMAGMSPSTQRAVIMAVVFLMTFLIEREQDSINTLSLAAVCILLFHPPALYSVSFQLSFSAVLAIIYGLSKISIPDNTSKNRLRQFARRSLGALSVSTFAILGTLPLVMFYFNQISIMGVLTNMIFIPLIGFVTVPMGLLAISIYPVSGFAAFFLMKIAGTVLWFSLKLMHWFSCLPFAAVKTVSPSLIEILCYYILFWSILNLKTKSALVKRTAIFTATAAILVFCADTCYWLNKRFWHEELRVTVIDVGQGSAALLELPGGTCYLVDGGGFYDNSVFDIGANVIAPFLWQKKIKTVDTLVLSHPNSDHLNGLIYIADNFNVKKLWSTNETADTFGYRKLMAAVRENKIEMPVFSEMPRSYSVNSVNLKILYPPEDFLKQKEKEGWRRNNNNNSLVLKVQLGSHSFLFPGDLQEYGELELIAIAGKDLESTVLAVPHHGSRTSSSIHFINSVNPRIAVFSSAWMNRFNLPHSDIIKRYQEQKCLIYRTDINGAVTMSTDGASLSLTSFIAN